MDAKLAHIFSLMEARRAEKQRKIQEQEDTKIRKLTKRKPLWWQKD